MGTTAANQNQQSVFKIGIVENEISFHEERLSEFKSIQHSFKDYISKAFVSTHPETDHNTGRLDRQWNFLVDGQRALGAKHSFWNKESGHLDNLLQIFVQSEAGYEEMAKDQIAGFEDFLERRLEGALRGIAEKEMRLIRKVELAIAAYRGYNCVSLYNKFKRALAEYFVWLERKINKSVFYLRYLSRFLSGPGIVVDFRQLLRSIMCFLCRRLDDEHGVNQKISNYLRNYFFGVTRVNYEYRQY